MMIMTVFVNVDLCHRCHTGHQGQPAIDHYYDYGNFDDQMMQKYHDTEDDDDIGDNNCDADDVPLPTLSSQCKPQHGCQEGILDCEIPTLRKPDRVDLDDEDN